MGVLKQAWLSVPRLGPRRAESSTVCVSVLAGAAGREQRENAPSGIGALALIGRTETPVRLIACGTTLPDMEVGSFFQRCAELYPEAFRVLVLELHGDVATESLLERFHAQAFIIGPLTRERGRELLASADASALIRRENHALRADLTRAQAKIDGLCTERSRLLRFVTDGARRVTSVAEMSRWWDSVCRYVEAEASDMPAFAQAIELAPLIEEIIDSLHVDASRTRIRNGVSCHACARVDRVNFRECVRLALRGLATGAPGTVSLEASRHALTFFHEQWDLSLTEIDELLEPFARLPEGPLSYGLDLPLSRVLAERQGFVLYAQPGPHCRGVALVLELAPKASAAGAAFCGTGRST